MTQSRLSFCLKRISPMIYYAISIHYLYGYAILALNDEVQLIAILGGFHTLIQDFGATPIAITMIVVATIALLGILFEKKIGRIATIGTLMPQYILLFYAFMTSISSMIFGLDVMTSQGIRTIQGPIVLAGVGPIALTAFWHTLAIFQRILTNNDQEMEVELLQRRIVELELQVRANQSGT